MAQFSLVWLTNGPERNGGDNNNGAAVAFVTVTKEARLCNIVQSWPKKCVLSCVNLPPQSDAGSRNLEHTFLANSVPMDSSGQRERMRMRKGPRRSGSRVVDFFSLAAKLLAALRMSKVSA